MQNDLEQLSYRDLAERLNISPDAARMKAKRKAKAGLWRIIPGNHPSERVMIELPATDLREAPKRVGGEQSRPTEGERLPRTKGSERGNVLAEQLLVNLGEAQARIQQLTDQLVDAKDVLVSAYDKLNSNNRELAAAQVEALTAKQETLEVKEAHRRDAMELTAAEMREMGTKAELERALADVAVLQDQLRSMKPSPQPWWKRLFR
jgi:DNA-binding Lrp family transcriptional regulator